MKKKVLIWGSIIGGSVLTYFAYKKFFNPKARAERLMKNTEIKEVKLFFVEKDAPPSLNLYADGTLKITDNARRNGELVFDKGRVTKEVVGTKKVSNNITDEIFNLAVELKDYDFKRYGSVTSNILITSTDGSKHQITFNPNSHSEDVSSEVLEIVELIKNLA